MKFEDLQIGECYYEKIEDEVEIIRIDGLNPENKIAYVYDFNENEVHSIDDFSKLNIATKFEDLKIGDIYYNDDDTFRIDGINEENEEVMVYSLEDNEICYYDILEIVQFIKK